MNRVGSGWQQNEVSRGAAKSFDFSYFLICSTAKINFLGCVKEVKTTKS
jgi:hypothetical protein